jgi:hypothetical protein
MTRIGTQSSMREHLSGTRGMTAASVRATRSERFAQSDIRWMLSTHSLAGLRALARVLLIPDCRGYVPDRV